MYFASRAFDELATCFLAGVGQHANCSLHFQNAFSGIFAKLVLSLDSHSIVSSLFASTSEGHQHTILNCFFYVSHRIEEIVSLFLQQFTIFFSPSSLYSRHQTGMHQDETPPVAHRVQVLPDYAGWSWNPNHQMVWI